MFEVLGRTWKSTRRWWAVLVAVLLVWQPTAATAQFGLSSRFELAGGVQLDEIDGQARAHLARIDAFLADQQWDEAIEALGRLM